jgi:hypothetical protein
MHVPLQAFRGAERAEHLGDGALGWCAQHAQLNLYRDTRGAGRGSHEDITVARRFERARHRPEHHPIAPAGKFGARPDP